MLFLLPNYNNGESNIDMSLRLLFWPLLMWIEFLAQLLLHVDQHMIPWYLYQEIVTLLARLHDYKLQTLVLRLDELVECVRTLSASSDQQILTLLWRSSVEWWDLLQTISCSVCIGSLALQSKQDTCFPLDYIVSCDVIHSHRIQWCVEKTADILCVMNEVRSLFLLLTTPLVYGTDVRLQSQHVKIKNNKMSL
jgi:hypothetical protein